MSHFAQIDENNIVINVIVAEQAHADKLEGTWIQTSYNTSGGVHYGDDGNPDGGVALRCNYAGIGMIYDETIDGFIREKPYASWTLNSTSGYWEPPIPVPDDEGPGNVYLWSEENQSWSAYTDTTKAPIFPS